MKIFIPILLGFCFLLQNISKTIIVLNYQTNKEYIAKNLCVNRDKEDNCCMGKCELKKQLDEDDKNSNVPESGNKLKIEKNEYCDTGYKINVLYHYDKAQFSAYLSKTREGVQQKKFRPPCCSSLTS